MNSRWHWSGLPLDWGSWLVGLAEGLTSRSGWSGIKHRCKYMCHTHCKVGLLHLIYIQHTQTGIPTRTHRHADTRTQTHTHTHSIQRQLIPPTISFGLSRNTENNQSSKGLYSMYYSLCVCVCVCVCVRAHVCVPTSLLFNTLPPSAVKALQHIINTWRPAIIKWEPFLFWSENTGPWAVVPWCVFLYMMLSFKD